MERTLVLFKPSAVERGLVGKILTRFEQKGLIIEGIKMMQLNEALLREHYSHLVDRPFFPSLLRSMQATPVIALCLKGNDAINVVRLMTGATNGRQALPGTIRGDFSASGQENVVHASSCPEDAAVEVPRFFRPEELTDWTPAGIGFIYDNNERL
ncbi:MAG: nucleoside-diphosphate kinase [Muribaculaceae bacterium]|nr:nucleoside-diphosphate kinase [Muribaculaceae bacterium]